MPKGLVPIAPLRRGLFVLGRNEERGRYGGMRHRCSVQLQIKVKELKGI